MKIQWKKGSHISVKPDFAFQELERIRKENNGELSPELVVENSKDKNAPLHNEFEWNNKIAGEKYRREQARYIIRSIEIQREEVPNSQSRVYEMTMVTPEKKEETPRRVFKTIEDILQDPIARDELLASAIRDAIAYRRRYHALSELSKVFKELDTFLESSAI